jgi:hypothetical protein
MKITNGFVTNSSSTCHICEVSGETESGIDLTLSDAGMVSCENGHVFLESYIRKIPGENDTARKRNALIAFYDSDDKYVQRIAKYKDNVIAGDVDTIDDLYNSVFGSEVLASYCPICALTHVRDRDLIEYLLATIGTTRDKVVNEIRGAFPDLAALTKYNKLKKDQLLSAGAEK